MTRPKHITIAPADANLVEFASNVTGAIFTLTNTATSDGLAHQVSIKNDSATDHSGKTVTLVGTDSDNKAISEVVTGPEGSATVESALYFKTVTSATPSATIGADTFDIGMVDEVISQSIPLDHYNSNVALNIVISGTIDCTVQQTLDKIQATIVPVAGVEAFTWLNHNDANLVGITTSVNGNYDYTPTAGRIKINSYSSGGSVAFNILQARS